jgi:S1-C subfamily serine protease
VSGKRTTRTTIVVAAALAAIAGGVAAIGIGKAAGWLDEGETVVLRAAELPSPPEPADAATAARPLAGDSFDPAQIYRERSEGAVTIYTLFPGHDEGAPDAQAQGSGFVVSPEGYILTNSHVITTSGEAASPDAIEAATDVFVEFSDGARISAEIVGWDLFDDVGLIKVDPAEHPLVPVPLGDSSRVVVGDPVAAIGSPFGRVGSLAVGVVSATQRSVESLTSDYSVVDAIQIDAPINRGNSGGPLFNARGEVIGINAQIRTESGNAEGVGFAIPINAAKRSMEQLIESGEVRYAWVGISTQTLTASLARELGVDAEGGAAIQTVIPESPAAVAGLRAGTEAIFVEGVDFLDGGDIVVAIDGEEIMSTDDLIRIVTGRLFPGQTAEFTVLREGERVRVSVVLADRPLNPDAGP